MSDHNPYASPDPDRSERPPHSLSEVGALTRRRVTMSTNDAPTRDDSFVAYFGFRLYMGIAGGLIAGWMWLLLYDAMLWAGVSAVVVVLLSGIFTTRFLLNIHRPLLMWGLAPVCGSAWLLFFWLLWLLGRAFRII